MKKQARLAALPMLVRDWFRPPNKSTRTYKGQPTITDERRQRAAKALQLDLAHLTAEDRFTLARRMVLERTIDLVLEADCSNRSLREQCEIQEMFSCVLREMADSGRDSTWHLLRVLDWDGRELAMNENTESVRLRLTPGAVEPIDHAATDHEWRRQKTNVAQAINSVMDSLEIVPAGEIPTILSALHVLHEVHEWCIQRELAWEDIRRMHGRVRRSEHVKGAALRTLMVINSIDKPAKLAQFIVDANERRPRPCPVFARDDVHENVRQILSRSKL